MFYGFSSVKCATSGILPVSRCEQIEVDDLKKLVATNRRIATALMNIKFKCMFFSNIVKVFTVTFFY